MNKNSKIYIAGHRGLVGSAIMRNLSAKGYHNLIVRTHAELDLMNSVDVKDFFDRERPEYVILAAAHVGGILANNTYRADFIYNNLQIQQNVIGESFRHNIKKLLFLGSTCIYPREAEQPIKEDALLTSPLEYTNEPYAIAKIAGLKMCESFNLQYGTDYIAVMPTNLYGPGDNFDLDRSHVLPAMIRKIHLAKLLSENNFNGIREDFRLRNVSIDPESDNHCIKDFLASMGIFEDRLLLWGSGTPLREFLWSDDMADASVHILENVSFRDLADKKQTEIRNCHINIGTGKECSISETASMVRDTIGYKGTIEWDNTKPDGTMRKLCDVSRLHSLGWRHSVELKDGIKMLYDWYLGH